MSPVVTHGDVWRHFGLLRLGVPPAFDGWGPEMLLNTHSAQDGPTQRKIQPKISVVLNLRNPEVYIIFGNAMVELGGQDRD